MVSEARVREILSKLRVKSGLRGQSIALDPSWRVGFFHDRDRKAFVLDLSFGDRTRQVQLLPDDVETKGRSIWIADNTWRLSKKGVDRLSSNIAEAIERFESKQVGRDQRRRHDRDPESLVRLQSELSHAREESRFWARQEHRLTRDEYGQKMRAERRVQELEAALARKRRGART